MYEQTFRRGDPDGPLHVVGEVPEGVTGSRVTFKPDPEMFKETTVFNFDTLEKRQREESFLNAGLKSPSPMSGNCTPPSWRTARRASPATGRRSCATRAASAALSAT